VQVLEEQVPAPLFSGVSHLLANTSRFLISPQRPAQAAEINEYEEIEMEARATFSGASVPKGFMAATAVIAAMCLAAAGGYAARGLSGSDQAAARTQAVHAAAGSVLRQDNPAAIQRQSVVAAPGSVLRQDNPKIVTGKSKVDEFLTSIGYQGGATIVTPAEPRSTGHGQLP
jgi:hypothetical protein